MAYSSQYRRCAARTNTKVLAVISVALLTMCMSSGSAQPGHLSTTQVERNPGGLGGNAIAGEESVSLVPAVGKVESHRALHVLLGDTVLENHLNSVVYFTRFMGGYPTGVNQYTDLAKVQRFDIPRSLTMHLKYAWIAFFDKTIVGTPDDIELRVWGVGPTGAPDQVLYSKAVSTSSFIARSDTAKWTGFSIQPAVTVSGPFFIGLEWTTAADDTFGIFTEWDGEGDLADRAWEKWSSGEWYMMRGFWPTFDRDLWVAATASFAESVELYQNYPNPFNPTTKIQFTIVDPRLPHQAQHGGQGQYTIVKVFDVLGREAATLVNEVKEPGTYTVQFDGSHLASGVYFYRLIVGEFSETRKLLLVR